MAIPSGVSHNPFAQTDFGIVAEDGGDFYPDPLAVISFGFLFGSFWVPCDTDATTVWTPVADASTTWSECA